MYRNGKSSCGGDIAKLCDKHHQTALMSLSTDKKKPQGSSVFSNKKFVHIKIPINLSA